MKSKFFFWLLFAAAIVTGCNKDDDDNTTPGGNNATGATMSVAVVFAPGQLGDMGFADNVLEGVYRLKVLDHQAQPDTLDVEFLAGADLDAAKEMVEDWFDNAYNDYTAKLYERRLLVLTEPFMVDWVEPFKTHFTEWDEVLVMKMNQDDVTKAASRLGLGNRLHGINISAASSVRRYCQYIRQTIQEAEEDHQMTVDNDDPDDDDDYKPLNCNEMLMFRLYDASTGSTYPLTNVSQEISFVRDGYVGTINKPVIWENDEKVLQTLALNENYNWVSLYVAPTHQELNQVFSPVAGKVSAVEMQDSVYYYDNRKWTGNPNISAGTMMKVQMSQSADLYVAGQTVNPAKHPITINFQGIIKCTKIN